MSDPVNDPVHANDCACCQGLPAPAAIFNPPGQPRLQYRIDIQPTFLARMLSHLASQEVPGGAGGGVARPLAALTARAVDDPSIALLDAWATVADVLTFYQERIANEGFLRTATERRSVLELAREIGYELSPGVAASADLVFTMEDAVGVPRRAVVPIGTRVLSVPGQNQKSQTFETVEPVETRTDWNALLPLVSVLERVFPGQTDLYVAGVATQIQPGDALLFVGESRFNNPGDSNWDVRIVVRVQPDNAAGRTRLFWAEGLRTVPPASVFVFRRRSGLFGNSAPHFTVLPTETKNAYLQRAGGVTDPAGDWPPSIFDLGPGSDELGNGAPHLDFDVNDPKIAAGSWVALASSNAQSGGGPLTSAAMAFDAPGAFDFTGVGGVFPLTILGESVASTGGSTSNLGLFRVGDPVTIRSRADFATSGTVTRVLVDTVAGLTGLKRRDAHFFVESEALTLAARPLLGPLDGNPDTETPQIGQPTSRFVTLVGTGIGLQPGQKVALTGKRSRVLVVDAKAVADRVVSLVTAQDPSGTCFGASTSVLLEILPSLLVAADGTSEEIGGTELEVLEPPVVLPPLQVPCTQVGGVVISVAMRRWHLQSARGTVGFAELPVLAVDFASAPSSASQVGEVGRILRITQGDGRTVLELEQALQQVYDRTTVTVSANVAGATHGETVPDEILGSGDATLANQTFVLKKPPLTFLSSSENASGALSTLEIRVNGTLWHEVPALFGSAPDAQVYMVRRTDDGQSTVIFGDGTQGARLPTGPNNVHAHYRTGIGLDGDVAAASLILLATRPLGIRSVTNPSAANGAAEPATIGQARQQAPLTIRTLDRVVSVADVEDFAASFAGVGKSQAVLVWNGATNRVHLTVADAKGAPVPATSVLFANLSDAVRANAEPTLLLDVDTFNPVTFGVSLQVRVDPDLVKADVQSAVRAALVAAYSFSARDFGQAVSAVEVLATTQQVPGVVAANILALFISGQAPAAVLPAQSAHFDGTTVVRADLLVIDPQAITLSDL